MCCHLYYVGEGHFASLTISALTHQLLNAEGRLGWSRHPQTFNKFGCESKVDGTPSRDPQAVVLGEWESITNLISMGCTVYFTSIALSRVKCHAEHTC